DPVTSASRLTVLSRTSTKTLRKKYARCCIRDPLVFTIFATISLLFRPTSEIVRNLLLGNCTAGKARFHSKSLLAKRVAAQNTAGLARMRHLSYNTTIRQLSSQNFR